MKTIILPTLLLFISNIVFAQKTDYSISSIPENLKENANAVVRLSQRNITISSQKSMTIKSINVVTVLNELGLKNLDLVEYYDKNTNINKIEATAFDAFGKQLKAYKRRDFKDISAIDDGTLFSDGRLLHLDYTPTAYPFSMVLESEIETSNTAFIPAWSQINNYLVSTESTSLVINYKPELHLKTKEINFSEKYPVEKKVTDASISYSAKNLVANKYEELAPNFDNLFPKVMFGLDLFSLEGLEGNSKSWGEMGKWFYDEILFGTTQLSDETKIKIKNLVGDEKNTVEIAKIIYQFVQDKTRYVSIQEGIGGWKPMLAKDVDKLGYGDCKALTNYTRALLNEVGVLSYYARLYGDNEKKEIFPDIVSFQSNHVILALPYKSDYIWLECTSQTQPFGFQGSFTDDRNAFIIKPEGSEIVKTKTYTETDNTKIIKGFYTISPEGNLSGKVKMISRGIQYDNEFGKERMNLDSQKDHYKEEFSNINNLKINKVNYSNNKEKIEFTEDLELEAEGYAKNSGGKLLFALNAFDQSYFVPKKYKIRELPFQILRGFTDEDEIEITIPNGFSVEAKPTGTELDTEFGNYKIEFITVTPTTILCKRKFLLKKGLYDKEKYENYRKFRESIAKNDNSKIVIAKI
jgi:hypothetical protein